MSPKEYEKLYRPLSKEGLKTFPDELDAALNPHKYLRKLHPERYKDKKEK